MNKSDVIFGNGKALIPFITAGDPNLHTTRKLLSVLEEAGADLIEIGIPFSDPVAEGIVIQKADERALSAGITTDKIFEMVVDFRKESNIPLAFMTYMNPIFVYGIERFAKKCIACDVKIVIIPDVPFEEKGEIQNIFSEFGIDVISFIAPTSKDRIRQIAREARGFVYCVSSMGVTGVRSTISTDVGQMITQIKNELKFVEKDIPCAIGFGISTPEQAASMAKVSDGVIIGSAIVRIIEKYGEESILHVRKFVEEMKKAINPISELNDSRK